MANEQLPLNNDSSEFAEIIESLTASGNQTDALSLSMDHERRGHVVLDEINALAPAERAALLTYSPGPNQGKLF